MNRVKSGPYLDVVYARTKWRVGYYITFILLSLSSLTGLQVMLGRACKSSRDAAKDKPHLMPNAGCMKWTKHRFQRQEPTRYIVRSKDNYEMKPIL